MTEKWYRKSEGNVRNFFISKSLFIFNLICYWILQGKFRSECVVYFYMRRMFDWWENIEIFFSISFQKEEFNKGMLMYELWRRIGRGLDPYKMSINFWWAFFCSFLRNKKLSVHKKLILNRRNTSTTSALAERISYLKCWENSQFSSS